MNAYTGALIAIFVLMNVVFVCAYRMRRNDLADIIWGPGFLVASVGAYLGQNTGQPEFFFGWREILFFSCLTLWALRLFFHIGLRNLKKSDEDIRYRQWRQEWGSTWVWRSYLQVFLLQGLIMFIIALPAIIVVQHSPTPLDSVLLLGTLVWIFGFFFEALGDYQLKQFSADPKNKGTIMDRGLWSWSRHPNYFGEVVQWWGLFLMVATLPQGWLAIFSPLAITFLILKVSGVPMLEELMKSRKGYAEYASRTSVFFPLPPKNKI